MSPSPRRPVPPSAGLARQLYAEGVPIAEICARTGLSTGSAYHWIDREVAADGSVTLRPSGRRAGPARPALPMRPTSPAPPPRARLLARLWRAAERQVEEIETRMHAASAPPGAAPRPAAEAEKDARALALIARTLRELVAAEDDASGTRDGAPTNSVPPGAEDGDDSGRDLDDFRRELARRLERMRAEPEDGAPPVE